MPSIAPMKAVATDTGSMSERISPDLTPSATQARIAA